MAKFNKKPMATKNFDKLVVDSSVILGGILSKKIGAKEIVAKEIIVPEAFLTSFGHMANLERAMGFIGLDELKKLKELLKDKLRFAGKRPSQMETKHLEVSDLDIIARQLAFDEGAVLVTTENSRAMAAEANGIEVLLVEMQKVAVKLKIEKLFDDTTMSVHLKENVIPHAKKGKPGEWVFVPIRKTVMKQDEIKDISEEILESPKSRSDSFIEIERPGSTIVQMSRYRTVITRPPFSDGWEITASRPVKKLNFLDYEMSEELLKRIEEEATGILIAGAPGSGKTTFASSLAEYYADKNKIVKTIEAPRDMILSERITQYAISHGDAQEIHDILLLSRPDYSIFDEMRNTSDFELYIDLRLAGIGLAGVIDATKPIDAVQRFIKRTELGVIPQVIDTLIFIDSGKIGKVMSINMSVKVPTGMVEADLARPVVEVRDFTTKRLEYEMYSYGEETVVVPVAGEEGKVSAVKNLASKQIERAFMKYTNSAEAEMLGDNKAKVYVPERDMASIIGKNGKNITEIEKRLGVRIQLEAMKSARKQSKLEFDVKERGNSLLILTNYPGESVDTFVEGDYLFTSTTSKKGEIKVSKRSNLGQTLIKALDLNKKIELYTSE